MQAVWHTLRGHLHQAYAEGLSHGRLIVLLGGRPAPNERSVECVAPFGCDAMYRSKDLITKNLHAMLLAGCVKALGMNGGYMTLGDGSWHPQM